MSRTTAGAAGYGLVALVSLIAAALLLVAVSAPVRAEHEDSHVAEKFVEAVNGQAVDDPNRGAGAGFVEVETNDLVQFRIRLRNQTGETVNITDVFKTNQFAFVSSEEGACDPPTASGQDSSIECSVNVVETGANFLLTFRVLTVPPPGEGCPTITNTAHIEGVANSSDVAQVKVCGTESVRTPRIVVDKVVTGTGASTSESFSISVAGTNSTITAAAQPTIVEVQAGGTHTVAETLTQAQITAGWRLAGIQCTSTALSGTFDAVDFRVATDETVTCVITNNFAAPAPSPSQRLLSDTATGASSTDAGALAVVFAGFGMAIVVMTVPLLLRARRR